MVNRHGWEMPSDEICEKYISACKDVVFDNEKFKNFKMIPEYQEILEHVDNNLGLMYYQHIISTDKQFFYDNYEKFCENDLVGNPKKYNYDSFNISPTTLRYIKNTLDMSSLCEDIEINKIVEIGPGYGGLCKTLSTVCNFEEYCMVDLPEVIELQKKYMSNFKEVYSKIKFIPCNKLEKIENVDLFISNYAFSELDLKTQNKYYDNIIKTSKVVYITHNSSNRNLLIDKLTKDDFKIKNIYRDYGNHDNTIIACKK